MNLTRVTPMVGVLGALIFCAAPYAHAQTTAAAPDGPVVMLTDLQINSSTVSSPPTGWKFGFQNGGSISVGSTASPDASATTVSALEGSYPAATGGTYAWANYSVASLNTEDIYVEFWAKMPAAKEGCKFLKIFGQRLTSTNYADTTIQTDYSGADPGAILQAGFGDGTGITNDFQNTIFFNGANPALIGRSYGIASVQTPQMASFASSDWGTGWHHFRVHVKFNSGTTTSNETPNGELYVEIDGKVYANATGLYNRNPSNGPIDYVEFYGWAQNDASAFQLWYDDIRITTGGFESTPLPDPPGGISVQ